LEYRASDGALLSQITLLNTSGIASDGKNIWVAKTQSDSIAEF
jgi:hypothetical protein